jgi:uncharacterized membrane protein (UPF0127 family)
MINIKVKNLISIKDRTIGLIGHSKMEPIMFTTRFGIHTFGVKFPIDVVILDRNNVVVKIKQSLKQNRFFFWPVRYNKVLELPEGYIEKYRVKIGSIVKL